MADDLDRFITALTTVWEGVTGINQAPEHPTSPNNPPMVLCYFVRGRESNAAACMFVHTVHCDVVIPNADLAHAETQSRPYILRGLEALYENLTMSGTCENLGFVEYQFGPMPDWGNMFGVRFVLNVKMQHTEITPTA